MTGSDTHADDEETGKALGYDVVEPVSPEPTSDFGVQEVYVDGSEPAKPPSPAPRPVVFVVVGIAAVIGLGVLFAVRSIPPSGPQPFQNLGAGVSNATGMKGNLQVRWQNKAAQYILKMEPIDPLQSDGFSYVVANPPAPLFLRVKLLDATGFAVCNKDILFPFDPGSPGEAARERGQDVFQSSMGDDGTVMAVSAQGTLPCTAAQYKQIVYWDLSTNFPALAEQDELMKQTAQLQAQQETKKQAAVRRRRAPRSAFYTEGDDRVAAYDGPHKLLETALGRHFLVSGSTALAMASTWAANEALIHYRCDQHSRCVLTNAGGTESFSVLALQ